MVGKGVGGCLLIIRTWCCWNVAGDRRETEQGDSAFGPGAFTG